MVKLTTKGLNVISRTPYAEAVQRKDTLKLSAKIVNKQVLKVKEERFTTLNGMKNQMKILTPFLRFIMFTT